MSQQTNSCESDVTEQLKRLCIIIGANWMENGRASGFTLPEDGVLDILYRHDDDKIEVTSMTGAACYFSRWEAPGDEVEISQTTDDGNLLTKLTAGREDCEQSFFWWGPPARYRGGAIRLQDPDADREEHILDEVEQKDVDNLSK